MLKFTQWLYSKKYGIFATAVSVTTITLLKEKFNCKDDNFKFIDLLKYYIWKIGKLKASYSGNKPILKQSFYIFTG